MAFEFGGAAGGALSGAAMGSMLGPGGALMGAAAGGLLGGFGRTSTGGALYGQEEFLPGHTKMALANLRGMLSMDPANVAQGLGYFAPGFQYWGPGTLAKWREQLTGATREATSPILREVAEGIERDFARRGLVTGGAAGAARARALTDIAARMALPIEQRLVGLEETGIRGKYGLQQYAMGLALGAPTLGGFEREPERETFLGGLLRAGLPGLAQGYGYGLGSRMFAGTSPITQAATAGMPQMYPQPAWSPYTFGVG